MTLSSGHTYDFGESVYVLTIQKGSTISGIRCCPKACGWLYEVASTPDRWWQQNELRPACPNCYALWEGDRCQHCGYSLDDLDS